VHLNNLNAPVLNVLRTQKLIVIVVVTDIVYWRNWGLHSKELEVDPSEVIPEAHLPNKAEFPVTWEYTRYVFQNGGSESTTSHRELGNSYLSFSP